MSVDCSDLCFSVCCCVCGNVCKAKILDACLLADRYLSFNAGVLLWRLPFAGFVDAVGF